VPKSAPDDRRPGSADLLTRRNVSSSMPTAQGGSPSEDKMEQRFDRIGSALAPCARDCNLTGRCHRHRAADRQDRDDYRAHRSVQRIRRRRPARSRAGDRNGGTRKGGINGKKIELAMLLDDQLAPIAPFRTCAGCSTTRSWSASSAGRDGAVAGGGRHGPGRRASVHESDRPGAGHRLSGWR